ncbi:MAG: hypothetical protein R2706_19550 [Acidimicrobiales bacterium]
MHIEAGIATIDVDLDGGRLAKLSVAGLDMLVPEAEKPTRWGSFPMIPWCGRLPFGALHFDGADYTFPITSAPHANHGRTHLQRWDVVDHRTIRTDLVDPWPFGGHAIQVFDLADDRLTVTVEVHAGHRPMPAMAGWHPWFRRQLSRGRRAELTFSAASMYATDDEATPTGELIPVPPGPWDACFVGLVADPVIEWPGAIKLTISSTFDHWVIFTEPEEALCVEPQSGPPNQLNANPVVLQPGESLSGSMTFAWS